MFHKPKRISSLFALGAIGLAGLMLLVPVAALPATNPEQVKFTLKSDVGDSTAIDVDLSFKMSGGEKAIIKPSKQTEQVAASGAAPSFELLSQSNPSFTVEPLSAPDAGWTVTAASDGVIKFSYKVKFAGNSGSATDSGNAQTTGEAPGGVLPPRAIVEQDLKAFSGSDALLAPQNQSGQYLSEEFGVIVQKASGESVLAPWSTASDGSFEIGSSEELLSNFLAWGKMTKVTLQPGGPTITAGFAGDVNMSDSSCSAYGNAIMKIHDEIERVMGQRPDEAQATVLVTGAARYGLRQPASESLRDSFLLFHGGSTLKGSAAAAASRGWFDLWNGVSLVASSRGDAAWMQDGLPWFYGYRVASTLGMLDANAAYLQFSGVYADYLTDPSALKTSLATAQKNGGAGRLLATKGAALSASMSVKLAREATSGGKNIEWLLGQMAKQFNHLEGKDYAVANVSEILEKATATSWDSFFAGRVGSADVIEASEFSTTDVFGTGGVVGGPQKLSGKGSGKNWIYLVIAILIIFSIPIIFSAYIRRAVRLDMTMPSILPDFDEDEEQATPAEQPSAVTPIGDGGDEEGLGGNEKDGGDSEAD